MKFKKKLEFFKLEKVFEASIISFIAITALAIYDFIIPLFTENFAENMAVIGTIISMGYVISFFVEVPVGRLVDKVGRVIVLVASLASLGILGILFFLVHSVYQLVVLVLLFGFAQIMFWVPSTVLIRDFSPRKLLSQSQGVYLTFSQLGWILGPVIAGTVTALFSDRHNFLVYSGFLFTALVVALVLFRGRVSRHRRLIFGKHKARLTFLIESFKRYAYAHKYSIPLYLLSLISYIWIAIEWTFIVLAGTRIFGLTESGVGIILSTMMVVQACLFFTSSYLMDKVGKKYIITAGFLLLFASSYFVFLSTNYLMFVFFLLLAGGSLSWILPGTEAYLTEIMPADIMGEMSGVFDTSKDLGFIIGPFVGGLLAEYLLGPMTPFLFVAVLSAIATLIAGYIFWPEKKTKQVRR